MPERQKRGRLLTKGGEDGEEFHFEVAEGRGEGADGGVVGGGGTCMCVFGKNGGGGRVEEGWWGGCLFSSLTVQLQHFN